MNNDLIEIRWHGRGGQGAVTSTELLALAAIAEGKNAQAFPAFGPERRGAPVLAFTRISAEKPILVRAGIENPDVIVVLEPNLLPVTDVASGLKQNGIIVVNSTKTAVELQQQLGYEFKIVAVNATAIARELLGVPIVNTTMLGALIKATGVIDINSLEEPLHERFGPRAKSNLDACRKAFKEAVIVEPDSSKKQSRQVPETVKLPPWQDFPVACLVTRPGSGSSYRTGDWRVQHPIWDNTRCIKCGICYIFCPEPCVRQNQDGYFEADYYYCKGCGICAKECWTGAITMVED